MADPKSGWVTLKGGTHVYLDKNGNISKGPNHFVGKNLSEVGKKRAPNKTSGRPTRFKSPSKPFAQYLRESSNEVEAAKAYYKNELQGHYTHAKINGKQKQVFFSRATGAGRNDLLKDMQKIKGKAFFVPLIPNVIATGKHVRTETPHHQREDFSRFHVFEKTVVHKGEQYIVTVKVGERKDGVDIFSFYYFNKKNAATDRAMDGALYAWALRNSPTNATGLDRCGRTEVILGLDVRCVNKERRSNESWAQRLAQALISLARRSAKRRVA